MCLLQIQYESSSDEEDTGEEVPEGGSPRSTVGLVDVEDMGQVMGKMKSAKSLRREVCGREGNCFECFMYNYLAGYCTCTICSRLYS